MEKPAPLRHFLGANSRYGFRSLYDDISHPERGEFLYIIKGGPGCGKSSFMRSIGRAAENAGLAVEYILCSGDPDSLDGVIIPSLGLAFADGTAPHSLDAAYPAGSSAYIDLGRFYDTAALRPKNAEIMDINRRYKALYATAYERISAAAAILPRCCGLWGPEEKQRLTKKLSALARRELPELSSSPGKVSHRFLSAISCKGPVSLPCPAGRVWLLDNELGLADFYLRTLADLALQRGHELIFYHDCLDPDLLSGLHIPAAGLTLLAPEPGISPEISPDRRVHLDALADREQYSARKSELRRAKKLSASLLELAVETLAAAKALHDELEALYNPHVDFAGVYAEADKYIRKLGF